MPTVPIDGRPQYPQSAVELVNAQWGRHPQAGVAQSGPGFYILEKYPPAPRTSRQSPMVEVGPPDAVPKTAAAALWPNLR
jgi:hypothetical protein